MARIPIPPVTDIPDADDVFYDNTGCDLAADNVKSAIDELCDRTMNLPFTDTMYWANCVCHCDGLMISDFTPLVDYTYTAIKKVDC